MITDALLNIVYKFLMGFLDRLPDMDLGIGVTVLNAFLDIVGTALYFFPWQYCLPILSVTLLLQAWRLIISIVKVIWELLPFV